MPTGLGRRHSLARNVTTHTVAAPYCATSLLSSAELRAARRRAALLTQVVLVLTAAHRAVSGGARTAQSQERPCAAIASRCYWCGERGVGSESGRGSRGEGRVAHLPEGSHVCALTHQPVAGDVQPIPRRSEEVHEHIIRLRLRPAHVIAAVECEPPAPAATQKQGLQGRATAERGGSRALELLRAPCSGRSRARSRA